MAIIDIFLIIVILAALAWDLKSQKIPNKLTLPAVVVGVFYNTLVHGWDGVLFSVFGLLVGLGIFMVPFMLGGIGGGDVKLMGAIGALKGWEFVLSAGLLTALLGGVIALMAIVITRRFKVLRDFGVGLGLFVMTRGRIGSRVMLPGPESAAAERLVVPYGIAIFAGTIAAYFVALPLSW